MGAHLFDQGQHRISRTYLKQFSFKDSRNADIISVLEHGNPITQHKSVKQFTRETNLFDTHLADPGKERFFEELSQKIETNYPKVLHSIALNGGLDTFTKEQLISFTANLLVRQSRMREYFFKPIFTNDQVRAKLLNEISLFKRAPEFLKLVLNKICMDSEGTLDDKVNLVAVEIMSHLAFVISRFTFLILKAPDSKNWFTSDNPVVINRNGSTEAWIIPPEAEIYFPLSPDYLLFLYNHRVPGSNSLRTLPSDKVSTVSDEQIWDITVNQISRNADMYTISPADLGKVDLRD